MSQAKADPKPTAHEENCKSTEGARPEPGECRKGTGCPHPPNADEDEREYPMMESSEEEDEEEEILNHHADRKNESVNNAKPELWSSNTTVWKDHLAKYVQHLEAHGYDKEFGIICGAERKNTMKCTVAKMTRNQAKNRYSDVLAYDDTRVILNSAEGQGYINASHVDGYRTPKAYICTQGPMVTTMPYFWEMVWEQKTACVVMATRLTEANRVKCDQYWPDLGSTAVYGKYQVTNKNEDWSTDHESYVIRELELSLKGSSESRKVTHYHLLAWPDHGIPSGTTYVLEILRQMQQLQTQAKLRSRDCGPVVIHCSAGIGRTGVLIAIDICQQSLADSGKMNLVSTVVRLRQQRVGMVQTLAQYRFCYQAILEGCRLEGEANCASS